MTISIVSGYFNPIHKGHIEYINSSKTFGQYLIVIVNSDNQVKLKGSVPFMDENHRMFVVKNLKSVDDVVLSIDTDRTVCETLKMLKQKYPTDDLYFFNSGDRTSAMSEPLEVKICEQIGINYKIIDLPKICSSSELIKNSKQ